MKSVLLTDEALYWPQVGNIPRGPRTVEGFLHYHATEGRAALVEAVQEAIFNAPAADGSEDGEAVVTALFGPGDA